MKNKSNLFINILTVIIGVLFIVLKNEVIGITMTIIGALLIIDGVLSLIAGDIPKAVVYIVLGIVVIVCGWLIATVVMYIFAAFLLIIGILQLLGVFTSKTRGSNIITTLLIILIPAIKICLGILLLFNQGGTIAWIFIVCGIFLVVDGSIGIIESCLN